jgi:hypothetical protein
LIMRFLKTKRSTMNTFQVIEGDQCNKAHRQ